MSTFQQRNIIRTFQDLNELIAPAVVQFKELDNCIIYPFSFDGTKFLKILESIKLDDDFHVKLQYNGMPLPLPQWFVQGHNATMKKEVIWRTSQHIYQIPAPTTTMNS